MASCDPDWSHNHNADWTATPAPTSQTCPFANDGAHSTISFSYPSYEPFGEATEVSVAGPNLTNAAYNYHLTYSAALQNGTDFGLVTQIAGDLINETKTYYTPSRAFSYDKFGNQICATAAGYQSASATGAGSTIAKYDADNRLISATDPDDTATAGCGKMATGNLSLSTSYTYYPDGNIESSQVPAEAAFGLKTIYTYDADGNLSTTNDHHGCTQSGCAGGLTHNFYDGDDRIIETVAPLDPSDAFYPAPWAQRFLYDLSQNGSNSGQTKITAGGTTVNLVAHGNLFSVQLYLPPATELSDNGWQDFQGNAFDALDRSIAAYRVQTGGGDGFQENVFNYDSTASTLGFLSSEQDADEQVSTFNYNPIGALSSVAYNSIGDIQTGDRQFAYDGDGQLISEMFGSLSQSYSYDAAHNLISETEPSGPNITSPASYSYSYYPDHGLSKIQVSSSAYSGTADQYYWNANGKLAEVDSSPPGVATADLTYSYSYAGRLTSYTVPGAQAGCCTLSYDSSANLAQYQVPIKTSETKVGYFKNSAFDAEGAPTLSSAYDIGQNNSNVQLLQTYNDRGEVISRSSNPTSTLYPAEKFHGFAGVMIPDGSNGAGYVPQSETFDYLNGAHESAHYNDLNDEPTDDYWTYDSLGRQSEKVRYVNAPVGYGITSSTSLGSQPLQTIEKQTTFDAEDQLLASEETYALESRSYENQFLVYSWSPSGHLITAGGDISRSKVSGYSPSSKETLHWAGDNLIFTTNGNGALDDFKIGAAGDYTTTADPLYDGTVASKPGLIFWGRDSSGSQTTSIGSVSSSFLPPTDPTLGYGLKGPDQAGTMPIQEPRSDGFTDLHSEFQGGRVYDYSGNQWLTQDQNSLEPDNIGSLRPYTFLGNSGSGIDSSGQDNQCSAQICYSSATSSGTLPVISLAPSIIGVIVHAIGQFISDIFGFFAGLGGHGSSHPAVIPAKQDDPYKYLATDEAFAQGAINVEALVVPVGPEAGVLEGVGLDVASREGLTQEVYLLKTTSGNVMKVGRTGKTANATLKRIANYRRKYPELAYVVVFTKLTREEARGLESVVEEEFSPILNRIRAIGPRNKQRGILYWAAARRYLKTHNITDVRDFLSRYGNLNE